MSADENKAIARRYIEGFWSQGAVPAEELLAPDYVVHDPGTPGRAGGIEGENQLASMDRAGFANLRLSVEDVLAEGISGLLWHGRSYEQQGARHLAVGDGGRRTGQPGRRGGCARGSAPASRRHGNDDRRGLRGHCPGLTVLRACVRRSCGRLQPL